MHHVPPRTLPDCFGAIRAKPKTPLPGGGLRARWKAADGTIYEWDYQHGHVEGYDPRGNHRGAFDANDGRKVSEANDTRRVEP